VAFQGASRAVIKSLSRKILILLLSISFITYSSAITSLRSKCVRDGSPEITGLVKMGHSIARLFARSFATAQFGEYLGSRTSSTSLLQCTVNSSKPASKVRNKGITSHSLKNQ